MVLKKNRIMGNITTLARVDLFDFYKPHNNYATFYTRVYMAGNAVRLDVDGSVKVLSGKTGSNENS